jgi:hypothetical protein
VRVHVTGATQPFWMVLGQSQSPGWQARIVRGANLHGSQLVDGYANGWFVVPPSSGAFDMTFEWTPQKQVWAALWISLLAALLCVAIVAYTWWRRRGALATAMAPSAGDADVDLAFSFRSSRASRRVRITAPVIAGLLGALVVTPWVGVLVALATVAIMWTPRARAVVMLVPGALLALCALYIIVEQYRYRYPSVFEWPTTFPHARTLAWIAVLLLVADAVVDVCTSVRRNARTRAAPDSGAPA